MDRSCRAFAIFARNTSSGASKICDAFSFLKETWLSTVRTQMPSLILPRTSARFGGENMRSEYSFQIRISQFECAILFDSIQRICNWSAQLSKNYEVAKQAEAAAARNSDDSQ